MCILIESTQLTRKIRFRRKFARRNPGQSIMEFGAAHSMRLQDYNIVITQPLHSASATNDVSYLCAISTTEAVCCLYLRA